MCVGLRDIQYLSPDKKRKKVDTARPTPRRVYRNYDVSQSLLGDGVLESSLKKFGRAPAEQTSRRGRRTNKSLSLPSKKATTEELFIAFKKSHGSSLLHLPSFSFLDTKKKEKKKKKKKKNNTKVRDPVDGGNRGLVSLLPFRCKLRHPSSAPVI